MGDVPSEQISLRLPEPLLDALDQEADEADMSRSTLIRRLATFGLETQADAVAAENEKRQEAQRIIEENQQLRNLLPSKWRSHIRGLFRDDLTDGVSPEDLALMAEGYRAQAEQYEEMAEEHPLAPDADLVSVVDEEQRHAMEAADLSNWYEGVENPHERALSGVSEGRKERQTLVAVVRNVVETHLSLEAATNTGMPSIDASDLPPMADQSLPEDTDREDVAQLARHCVEAGIPPEEIDDVPLTDPSLGVEAIEAEEGGQPDVEQPALRMGGEIVEEPGGEQTDVDDGPQVVEASETTQKQIQQTVAAADGGRDPDSIAGSETTMNPDNTDDETDASTEIDKIAEAAERAAAEGETDE